jgi:hypothetical protein
MSSCGSAACRAGGVALPGAPFSSRGWAAVPVDAPINTRNKVVQGSLLFMTSRPPCLRTLG